MSWDSKTLRDESYERAAARAEEHGEKREQLRAARKAARALRERYALGMIARWIALAIAMLGLISLLPSWWAQLAATVVAAGILQRQLSSGMMHEATHGTLFSTMRANAVAGRMIGAIAFIDFALFRSKHMRHHRWLATSQDPERQDLERYGMKATGGMTRGELIAMGLRVLSPARLREQAWATLRYLATHLGALMNYLGVLVAVCWLGGAGWGMLLGWLIGSFTVRPLLWLYANASEHAFPLGAKFESGALVDDSLFSEPPDIQWLAVSRERRGWIYWILTPESERLYHGDHHANPDIPGGALARFSRLRIELDPSYAKYRKVVLGLFPRNDGNEAGLSSLTRGT